MCAWIQGICFTEVLFPRPYADYAAATIMVLRAYEGMEAII